MFINGCDCLIVIKTAYRETGIPYAEETIREAVSLLKEEAAIEGDGSCRAIRKSSGVTGCVVTPLAIGTAPLLLYLAMGSAGLPLHVSETRNIYRYRLNLLPAEDSTRFDLIQDRGGSRTLYENCAVTGFELRCNRGEAGQQAAIHLKLDIRGERPPVMYPYTDPLKIEDGERFSGDFVSYRINEQEYTNIYGLTLSVKKECDTKTELRIKRAVVNPYPYGFTTSSFAKQNSLNSSQPPSVAADLPEIIEELSITAQLLRDKYEYRHYGMFRITLKGLVLVSDETAVDCTNEVIGPLRYYVAGTVQAAVFTSTGETLI
jgi:hypothetical protein